MAAAAALDSVAQWRAVGVNASTALEIPHMPRPVRSF